MRLLHVIPSIHPATGGPAEAVRTFVQHSLHSTQAVVTLDHSSDPWLKDFPGSVYAAGPGRGKYGYSPRLASWLRENAANYDSLLIHGCWQFHGPAAARAARSQRVPYCIFPHGMLDPWFQQGAPLKHLKKLCYWPVERSVLQGAARVLFTCEEERRRATRGFSFEAPGEIVPLGVELPTSHPDDARAAFFARFPKLREKRLVLFIGRLHRKKGLDLLLRAFAGVVVPGAHLVIAGPAVDSGFEDELRQFATRECGTDRVTFTGMLTGRLKSGALLAAEAFVLPSHQENFGIAVAEALASGLPVLISDQVNIWREIEQDNAGLVAPDTEAGVRSLLAKWFAKSESEINAMRLAARACWHSRFRAEAASRRLLSVISEGIKPLHEPAAIQFRSIQV